MSSEQKYVFTEDQLRRFSEVYQNWWWEHDDPNPTWEQFMDSEEAFEFFEHARIKPLP